MAVFVPEDVCFFGIIHTTLTKCKLVRGGHVMRIILTAKSMRIHSDGQILNIGEPKALNIPLGVINVIIDHHIFKT